MSTATAHQDTLESLRRGVTVTGLTRREALDLRLAAGRRGIPCRARKGEDGWEVTRG